MKASLYGCRRLFISRFLMGFQLLLKPAFADTHQAQETESQPELVKTRHFN